MIFPKAFACWVHRNVVITIFNEGLPLDAAAVALGATVVERHFTLDRAAKGTDHAASLSVDGLRRTVRDCRAVAAALGDGVKRVRPSEEPARKKLRGMG